MLLSVFLGCTPPVAGETIDIVIGTWFGELDEKQLEPGVNELEPSTLELALYDDAGTLSAKASFEGKLGKWPIVLKGPETDYIEGVMVDGDSLACTYVISNTLLDVTGVFSADKRWLDLTVEKVGMVALEHVVDEMEDGDTGDSG